MKSLVKNKDEVIRMLDKLGNQFILIKNPNYIFSPYEICPVAPSKLDKQKIVAVVMDMDGTTTTTEKICIHSLELMIRRMAGKLSKDDWQGLNQEDYPHIIGNSTTRHVEYLINKYHSLFNNDSIHYWYVYSALWTIKNSKDLRRISEVKNNLNVLGLSSLIDSDIARKYFNNKIKLIKATKLLTKTIQLNNFSVPNLLVRMGIDIYYQRYHKILSMISKGESKKIAEEFFGDKTKNLIEPMPGVLIFLCLVKGLLDKNDFKAVNDILNEFNVQLDFDKYKRLVRAFNRKPAKIGIVTSSIFYEADLVIKEVMKVLQMQIKNSTFSKEKKKILLKHFSEYNSIYDTIVTASDSSEIRLKPHRDLYSLALHQLNIHKKDYNKVMGLEDSESGLIAIRAAGIGFAIAVPFAETSGHNLTAASHICKNGLPELISKNLFMTF